MFRRLRSDEERERENQSPSSYPLEWQTMSRSTDYTDDNMLSGTANKEPRVDGSDAVEPANNLMIAARAAGEKKATDTVILDLRDIASFTEYFVICTGASTRQVQAISNSVEEDYESRAGVHRTSRAIAARSGFC